MMTVDLWRRRLRDILQGSLPQQVVSVHSPLSARLAAQAGAQAGFLGGSAMAADHLAAPDVGLLGLAEVADIARRCVRVAGFPLILDGDDGYGNALATGLTVRRLEETGVAALTLEDTVLPKAGGAGKKGVAVLSRDDFAARLAAAVAARRDTGLLLIGQTVTWPAGDPAETVARLRIMRDLGLDAAMPYGVERPEDLRSLAQAVDLPLFLAPMAATLNQSDLLAASRVRLVFHGHQPIRAAAQGLAQAYQALLADDREAAARLGLARPRFDAALAVDGLEQIIAALPPQG